MSIVLSSADENVTVRSTVLLVCVAYGGSNAPTIVWYRNGSPINNATDLRVKLFYNLLLIVASSVLVCLIVIELAAHR